MEIIYFIAGVVFGALTLWLYIKWAGKNVYDVLKQQIEQKDSDIIGLRTEIEKEKVRAATFETKLAETTKQLEENKKFFDDSTKSLSDMFSSLSKNALSENNKMFLDLAKTSLENVMTEAKGDLSTRQENIKNMIG